MRNNEEVIPGTVPVEARALVEGQYDDFAFATKNARNPGEIRCRPLVIENHRARNKFVNREEGQVKMNF